MADSVFSMNKLTHTSTAVPDAGVDNHIPAINAGVANGKRITSASFLAGITGGQDQVIVHGTQVTKIDGHLNTIILAGEDRTVMQGRTTTIAPTENHTVVGQRVTSITGNDQRTVLGSQIHTTIAGEFRNEVSSWLANQGLVKVKYGLVDVGLFGAKTEVVGIKLAFSAAETLNKVLQMKNVQTDLRVALLSIWLGLARPKIGVAKPDIGGVSTHAFYVGV